MKKWLRKISVFQLFVFLSCWIVSAQELITIQGKVFSKEDSPLPGVTVVVKGTAHGTVTNEDGNYTLTNVPGNATLVFSFVGMYTQEVAVGNKTNIDIRMEEETIGLEEVVAVGYGTMKKSDLTGSVVSVQSEDISAFPTTNVVQALEGRAAGVQVTQNTGEPGGSISVRIRGTNSIKGSNEPLYVVDGFPISGSNPTILNNLDVESIEILKDASATAIYGSRGANGVVLITTKSGKAGRTSVSVETNFAFQSIRKKLDMMNAKEYAQFYNLVAANDGWGQAFSQEEVNSFDEGFDWQDFVFKDNALLQNHSATVSGGNDKTQFSVSGSLYNEEGIIENSGYDRYSFRSNIGHNINEKIRISGNITLAKIKRENQSSSGGGRGTSLISGALYPFPTVTPWNEDGSWRNLKTLYHWSPEIVNPALMIYETNSIVRSNKVLANAAFEYSPIPDLTLKIMGGIENSDDRSDYYRTNDYIGTSAYASVSTTQFTSLLNENTISYTKTIGKHRISALTGFTYQDFRSTSLYGSGTDFLSDVQESYDLSSASVPGIPDSGYSLSVILSGLGRFNYNYDDKYLATINFRADGSSKYSEGNKWGFFPSGSLAWRVSNEGFMSDVDFISDLKIRAGYGETGSQAIGAYATLNNLYSGKTVFGGEYHTYFAPGTNLPGDLKWETTEQTNFGVDFGILDNRLRIAADYYIKRTRDLLNSVPLPPSGGFTSTIDNVGVISNRGLEFEINADILSGPVEWTVDANISFNRSKVEKLYKGQDILGSYINVTLIDDHFNILREGEPFSVFYGYLEDGYNETGRLGNYKDLTGEGDVNVRDKTIIGDPNPDFIYGLNSLLSYKNFDLTVFIQGSQGNDIFNLAGLNNTLDVGFGGNMPKDVLHNHWSPDNPDAKYPIPSRTNQIRVSDRFIEDGSYLRFRNIQLGYNIPFSKLGITGIKNVQVYVGGKNLITLTKYSRWDPEVNSLGGSSSINQGIDYHTYPVNKSVNFGIRADF
ncbi:TonB-dependent receptor [Mariniphaga sediminis]|uniref:TonB-dependent receptor n=1 Tax=Mariniphaga sediminis TaxID=1628158 RepID=A0A399D408_9BACT|nr:TonB-dependent receptor [Mariniphaga sediminis]RIH65402.1 TonB-dependent receptor [Mariniphaga sediminis]